MMEMENQKIEVNFLAHHGVTGQKWGERRYQNKDGSLTPLGRIHWGIGQARNVVSNKLKTRKSFRLETDSEKRKRLKLKAEKKEENKKLKLQKAEEVRQKREKAIEDKKAKIIVKGDKDAIYKNRELFSDEELDKAMARINKMNQFKTEKSSKQVEHLINRASPKEIYRNRAMLNDDELDRALNRISKLDKIKPEDKKALESLKQTKENRQTAKDGKNTVDKLISTGKTVVTVAGTAVALYEGYNKVASVINEISGENKLPTFKLDPWKNIGKKKETENILDNEVDWKSRGLDVTKGTNVKNNGGPYSTGYELDKTPETLRKLNVRFNRDDNWSTSTVAAPNNTKLLTQQYDLSTTGKGSKYKAPDLGIVTNTVWDLPRSIKDVYNTGTAKDFSERVAKRNDRSYKLGKKLQDDYEKRLSNKLQKKTGDGDLSNYMSSDQVIRDQNRHNRTAETIAATLYKSGSMINGVIAVGKSLGKWPSDSVNVSTVDVSDFYNGKLID